MVVIGFPSGLIVDPRKPGSARPRSSGFSVGQVPQNARFAAPGARVHDAVAAVLAVDGPATSLDRLARRVRERHDVAPGCARRGRPPPRRPGGKALSAPQGQRRIGEWALDPKSDTDMSMPLMSTRRRTRSWY